MAGHYDFYFMGCWNSESDLVDHRSQVIEQIRVNQAIYNYNFGLILGDNIYPTDFKKIQKIMEGNHKGGFKKLKTKKLKGGSAAKQIFPYSRGFESEKKSKKPKPDKFFTLSTFRFLMNFLSGKMINLETHIILGNHDIDNCSGEHMIKKIYTEFKDHMVFEEQKLVLGKYNYYFSNKKIKEEDNYVLIGLDTNKGLIRNLEEILATIINPEFNKWIIISGHIPLASIKPKKKANRITQKIKNVTAIYNVLKRINYRKIIYLCADTHNFQINELTICDVDRNNLTPQNNGSIANNENLNLSESETEQFSIPIIIAGTGGASPDIVDFYGKKKPYIHPLSSDKNLCVINNHIYQESFGYCDIKIDENDILVRYHHVTKGKIYKYTINNLDIRSNSTIDLYNEVFIPPDLPPLPGIPEDLESLRLCK